MRRTRGFHSMRSLPSLTFQDNHSTRTLLDLEDTVIRYRKLLHERLRSTQSNEYIRLWLGASGITDSQVRDYALQFLDARMLMFVHITKFKKEGNRMTTMWLKNTYGLYKHHGMWVDNRGNETPTLETPLKHSPANMRLQLRTMMGKKAESKQATQLLHHLLHVAAFDTMYAHVSSQRTLVAWLYIHNG